MKKKILLVFSALALTLSISLSSDYTTEKAVSEQDSQISYMYYDPDINPGIG